MKRVETIKKDLEKRVRAELKWIAERRFLRNYQSMDIDELTDILAQNVEGFKVEREGTNITISWLESQKRIGVIFDVDLPEGDITRDTF